MLMIIFGLDEQEIKDREKRMKKKLEDAKNISTGVIGELVTKEILRSFKEWEILKGKSKAY